MRNKRSKSTTDHTQSILLVGEHQVILQAMKEWLAPLGHRLTWVENGLEAIHQLRQRQFDMVITELAMPGLDGSLIAQYLRNTSDQATIVGLSPDWYHDRSGDPVSDSPKKWCFYRKSATCAGS